MPPSPSQTSLVLVESCGFGATETQPGLMGEWNPASTILRAAEIERAGVAQTIARK